jgi:hypothetical protein
MSKRFGDGIVLFRVKGEVYLYVPKNGTTFNEYIENLIESDIKESFNRIIKEKNNEVNYERP